MLIVKILFTTRKLHVWVRYKKFLHILSPKCDEHLLFEYSNSFCNEYSNTKNPVFAQPYFKF